MSWIDDDQAELARLQQSAAELREREQEIVAQSLNIYAEVWGEITEKLKEAEAKRLGRILTNGSYYERKLIVPRRPVPPQTVREPDEYYLRLSSNKQAITLTGPSTNFIFPLDVGTDNVVAVYYDGEFKTAVDVARLVLRPLLFPDLYGQK